jgi:CheY-like chemotaxis protein
MLRELLTYGGHEVVVAGSGADALAAAREFRPEVVLCDIELPGGLDGYAVARGLRAELGAEALLMALTGFGQDRDRERALAAGFDRHLTKPMDPSELDRLISAR